MSGQLVSSTPAGDVLPGAPAPQGPVHLDAEAVDRRVVINSTTGTSLWGGERLDLDLAITALLSQEDRN